jgi:hypothetical protein
MPKPDPEKATAEVKGIQQEIKNLEKALGELVDALIAEEKPGPKEIRKLKTLKKQALSKAAEKTEPKAATRKTVKPRTRKRS